jgi:DNA invertase Pin-like site-specific DNA recombinase
MPIDARTSGPSSTGSEAFGRFCAGLQYDALPRAAVERAKHFFIDYIGIALHASTLDSSQPLRRLVAARAQLHRLLSQLDARDVLMVTRPDRLARSTGDLLNTLAAITERKAGFRSLADTWTDTTTAHGRLMLTVLGGLAEFERELIRARTSKGRSRAKAHGVKMGRPPKLTPHQKKEALFRPEAGKLRDRLRMVAAASAAVIQAWDVDPREPWPDGRHRAQDQALPY